MKKILSVLFCLLLGVLLTVGLASCGKDVEFNVNFIVDGETYATIGTSGEETIKIPENPTKEGYTFDGWYWDNDVWEKPFTANSLLDTPLSSDMSVYAKWTEIQIDAPAPLQGTDIKSQQLTLNGDQISASLSNTTETFSFLNDLTVAENASYILAKDIGCEQTIASKTVTLEIGNNTYYVLVTNGNAQKLYTVTVRRRPMYTVSFTTNGGTSVSSQTVEEGSLATEPTTTRAGYTFAGWDHDFTTPIMGNTRITASWTANTDTPYKVEYYLQNIDDDGYTRLDSETENLTGTTGTRVTAEQKTFEHFTLNTYMSTLSGNVNGSGSLVLRIYYTRNVCTLSNANTSYGSITNEGSHKYGASVTATATTYIGCEFLGWYSGNTRITTNTTYTFTVEKNVEARFGIQAKVKTEMANFNFTSTATTCTITGLKDKTITEIVVPDYVTGIGSYAFEDCSGLTSITIPSSVTSIGSDAFRGCSGLTAVYITDLAAWCNISFNDSYSNPLYYAKNLYLNGNKVTALEIPEGVTSIGDYAFYNCSRLTSITIPNSVTSIGEWAFSGCSGIIQKENGVSYVDKWVIDCDTSVTSVTLRANTVGIGDYAFCYCSRLTSITIPEGVTSIGSGAFYDCSRLTSITIPDSVTSIGSGAFAYCSRLTSINYRGTEEQWDAITKGSYWSYNTGNYTINYNYTGE